MHFVERVRQSDHEKVDCRGHQIAMGSHCPDLVKLINIKAGDIGSSVAIESKSPEGSIRENSTLVHYRATANEYVNTWGRRSAAK